MPSLHIFAGINGAGKTTFYHANFDEKFGKRINTDEIASTLGDWRDKSVQNEAGKISIRLREKYILDEINFHLETTLTGIGIGKFITLAKERGYYTTVYYIGLDSVSIAKDRVLIRVRKNGHGVPDDVIARRFERSLKNIKEIAKICDEIYFYDNSQTVTKPALQSRGKFVLLGSKIGSEFRQLNYQPHPWFDEIKSIL